MSAVLSNVHQVVKPSPAEKSERVDKAERHQRSARFVGTGSFDNSARLLNSRAHKLETLTSNNSEESHTLVTHEQ